MTDVNEIKPLYTNLTAGTINSACVDCFGSGSKRYRNEIGGISIGICPTCHGRGGKPTTWGSGEHRVSASMVALRKRGAI